MASRYQEPPCQAIEMETNLICGRPMKILAERDPSFGPNFTPGHFVFRCTRCASIRAIDKQTMERYVIAK